MRELSTIQKREKLNKVYAVDEKGFGGANHLYHVNALRRVEGISGECEAMTDWEITFQNGARNNAGSTHGLIDSDLLEIVRDRLLGFQSGEFATRENACALTHIEEALMWLNRRVEDRIERNVLGTDNK